jgi:4,5-DOPA dioxygenase extradiol
MTARFPAIFFGHGNPMNAITTNAYTEAWRRIGESMPKPTAILCVSAHWYPPATLVTAVERPRTIHDFGGFPRELFAVQYPAAGDQLCARVRIWRAQFDEEGAGSRTWSVLAHVFPHADARN